MTRQNPIDTLMNRIAGEYESLPRQLKTIAKYIEQNRGNMMVARISDIAASCGVQPSAVTRFSQRFGFSGYSDLQALFRNAYTEQTNAAQNYSQRIRNLISSQDHKLPANKLVREFIGASRAGLEELEQQLEAEPLDAAVELLYRADPIYVVGTRRSYPAAAYLVYALQHTNKRVHMLSGVGGMYREQIRGIRANDVIVAISFSPYAKETQYCLRVAHQHHAKVIAITDSKLSPIARDAEVCLISKEASAYAFRSLASTISLCQGLFIALAYRLELDLDEPKDPGGFDV
jgi:DNA-binding MurR/RpiR family transcriptional regulator